VTLVSRVSLFFLGALALVLAGFSVTLYLAASSYLQRQTEERLDGALATLVAAVEFGPGGLEWEPQERRLNMGQGNGPEEVRWLIRDEHGNVLSKSGNLESVEWLSASPSNDGEDVSWETSWGEQTWRVRHQRLEAPPGLPLPEQAGVKLYPRLEATCALSLTPARTLVHKLAGLLAGLSGVILVGATVLGRRFCLRALTPLSDMAATARTMNDTDWQCRLPCTGTRDELDDLGRSFNDLLDRLQDAFERQRRFTGEASHQLRTPLTAMLGQVEVGLRRERDAQEYRRILSQVHGRAQQMQQIIDMLLFLARADADARLPDLERIDLKIWLPEQRIRWVDHARGGDIRIDLQAAEPYPVLAHSALLGQLLDNMIDNACKYSAPGRPIIVTLFREGSHCGFTVEDAGMGIDPGDAARIFEPFYRSAQSRQRGIAGAGLGLAVVQRIATALDGCVMVNSAPGAGSRFTLRLPADGATWEECDDAAALSSQSASLIPSGMASDATEL
jgi:signal transduction histidine kinase